MPLPLIAALGLMGLNAASSGGISWFRGREDADAAEKLKGILGQAPGLMYPGGADEQGPPQQVGGSGLMADPSDPRRQLQFAQGIMALPPEQRAAAHTLIDPILTRAQQQAGIRTELEQRATLAANDQAGIQARFDTTNKRADDVFAFDQKKYGEEEAIRRRKAAQDYALGQQQIEMNRLKLLPTDPNAPVMGNVPAGYERVQTPQGALTRPQIGTEPWLKEDTARSSLEGIYQNITALQTAVEKHGTETGYLDPAAAQNMRFLYGRVVSGLAKLEGTGRYNEKQMDDLRGQVSDPVGPRNFFQKNDKVLAGYKSMRQFVEEEDQKQQRRTAGWQGFDPTPLSARAAGRAAIDSANQGRPRPPAGTVPYNARG